MLKKISSTLLFSLSLSVSYGYEFTTENLYDIYLEQINISIDESGNIVETESATSPKPVAAKEEGYPALDPIELICIVRLVGILKDSSDYKEGTQPIQYTISEKYLSTKSAAKITVDPDDTYFYDNGDRRTRSDKTYSVTSSVVGLSPESGMATFGNVLFSETVYTYPKTESEYTYIQIDEGSISSDVIKVHETTSSINNSYSVQHGEFTVNTVPNKNIKSSLSESDFGTHIYSFYDMPDDPTAIANQMATARVRVFPVPWGSLSLPPSNQPVDPSARVYPTYATLPTTTLNINDMYPGSDYHIIACQGELADLDLNDDTAYTILHTRSYEEAANKPSSIPAEQDSTLNAHIGGNTGLFTFALIEENAVYGELLGNQRILGSITVNIDRDITVRGMVVGSEKN